MDVVEAAYDVSAPDDRWLRGILRASAADLDCGEGVYAFVCELGRDALPILSPVVGTANVPTVTLEQVHSYNSNPPPGTVEIIRSRMVWFAGLAQALGPKISRETQRNVGNRFRDVLGALAQDGEGRVVQLVATSGSFVRVHPKTEAAWRRVLLHVGTALRLRSRLGAPEAVLTPTGAVEDARSAAKTRSAREQLRDAVLRMERSRTARVRRRPEDALSLWQGLVAGRWSLIDQFESDGRRYIAAHENAPRGEDPRALSAVEQSYLVYYLRGATTEEIAFAFGKAPATVGKVLSSITRRLRLPSRVALRRMGEVELLDRFRVEVRSTPVDVIVVAETAVHPSWRAVLTSACLEVAELASTGLSDGEIAARRGRSTRTVSNQLLRVFRTLGVARREELARILREPRPRS